MNILESLVTGLTSGGLFGILGNTVNTLLAIKQKRLDYDHEEKMLPLQMAADKARADAQFRTVVEDNAGKAFTASVSSDTVTGKEHRWVLDIRALVRPGALFLLWCGVVAIWFSSELTVDLRSFIVHNVVTDASMALSWYFGARATDRVMAYYASKKP